MKESLHSKGMKVISDQIKPPISSRILLNDQPEEAPKSAALSKLKGVPSIAL